MAKYTARCIIFGHDYDLLDIKHYVEYAWTENGGTFTPCIWHWKCTRCNYELHSPREMWKKIQKKQIGNAQ